MYRALEAPVGYNPSLVGVSFLTHYKYQQNTLVSSAATSAALDKIAQ